ncbi:tyrosine-type recombinase/integrase [Cytophagaceae bacterium DM2B3-1]|uniref:Tyrosine-type recombinase/integrase n=1 Tax=Xanthocytophaga flava TaxID=3048013 RepID=A0ABT7CS25_9BACT|nr:tyrosine-type recombinase/integrase [Xanthocytophaga flavus]MDJ1496547.1 tyrosine-type recombinase/integrase [Xanthocytophaga flavus]
MSISLRKRTISNNRFTLYLDRYSDGQRIREFLKLHIYKKPKDEAERQHNTEVMQMAKSILYKRQQAELAEDHGEIAVFKRNVNFLEYSQKWVNAYAKKDKRVVAAMFVYLKDFVKEHTHKETIKPTQITESFCIDFKEFLENRLNGESPSTYFARFKKLLKKATRDKFFSFSPAINVSNSQIESVKKDVLSFEEIQTLAKAKCGNNVVRKAFLFACYTGLRFADIKELEWSNINGTELSFVQVKTEKKSPHKVRINLNPVALQILGEPGAVSEKIFILPTYNSVVRTIRNWAKRAGVQKHVTFHVARHSFATNLLYYQTDLMTVSSLLGHTTTKHTQKYVRVADSMKQQAVNRLPEIEFN